MAHLNVGNDNLSYVRSIVEWHTSNDPILSIDWTTYALIQEWCSYPDKLALILATLTSRLKSTAPSAHKALILLQALPLSAIIPIIEHIEPLTKISDSPYIAHIASHLLEAAKAEKARLDEASAKYKWELWSEQYGKSSVGWIELPKPIEPDWGWYGMRWVSSDEWWNIKPEGEGSE